MDVTIGGYLIEVFWAGKPYAWPWTAIIRTDDLSDRGRVACGFYWRRVMGVHGVVFSIEKLVAA